MRKILIVIVAFVSGAISIGYIISRFVIKPTVKELVKTREMSCKHNELYMLMNDWVRLKQNNKNLSEYFEKYGYNKIAIYGMNYVGKTLCEELNNSKVEIVSGIDKNATVIESDIKVCLPEDFNEKVDAIVVTPIAYFDEIADSMENRVDCPIISIEDIVYELCE